MDNDELAVQLKLLMDILAKKLNILQEILSITENQGILLKSTPENRELFMDMFDEKQVRIDNILAGDEIFNKIFMPLMEQVKVQKSSYKSYIADMQRLVKSVMDLEIRIRLEERNNNKYIQNIINTIPMKVAAKHYSYQKTQKIKDYIKLNKKNKFN